MSYSLKALDFSMFFYGFSNSPDKFRIRASVNGFATDLTSFNVSSGTPASTQIEATFALQFAPSLQNLTGPVTLRLIGMSGAGSDILSFKGFNGTDLDLNLQGLVVVPEPSTVLLLFAGGFAFLPRKRSASGIQTTCL